MKIYNKLYFLTLNEIFFLYLNQDKIMKFIDDEFVYRISVKIILSMYAE